MTVATVRQRRSTGEVVIPYHVFRRADYGQVCSMLDLKPSQPDRSADGRRRKAKR